MGSVWIFSGVKSSHGKDIFKGKKNPEWERGFLVLYSDGRLSPGSLGDPGKPRQIRDEHIRCLFSWLLMVLKSFLLHNHSPCSDLNNLTYWKPHGWPILSQTYQIHHSKTAQVGFWTSNPEWEFYKDLPSATKPYKSCEFDSLGASSCCKPTAFADSRILYLDLNHALGIVRACLSGNGCIANKC